MKSFWSRCKLRDSRLALGQLHLSELLLVLKDVAERLGLLFVLFFFYIDLQGCESTKAVLTEVQSPSGEEVAMANFPCFGLRLPSTAP